jgi:DNA-binding SARP family transcriptional activator
MLGAEVVRSKGPHYRLDVNPDAVDAMRFDDLVARAGQHRRDGDTHQAAASLAVALELWRGTPYPDVLDPDLQARRAKLTELRDQAREDLLDCRVATAADEIEVAAIVADARELVSRHPERDRGHVVLVRALERAGRTREAKVARADAAALGLAIAE